MQENAAGEGGSLNFFHDPKMGQAESLQRGFFQPLQYGAQQLAEGRRAFNDVVVCAEDRAPGNHPHWQTREKAVQVGTCIDFHMRGQLIAQATGKVIDEKLVAKMVFAMSVNAMGFKGITAVGAKEHNPPTRL